MFASLSQRLAATRAIPRIPVLSCVTTAGAIGCSSRQWTVALFVFLRALFAFLQIRSRYSDQQTSSPETDVFVDWFVAKNNYYANIILRIPVRVRLRTYIDKYVSSALQCNFKLPKTPMRANTIAGYSIKHTYKHIYYTSNLVTLRSIYRRCIFNCVFEIVCACVCIFCVNIVRF